MGPRLRKIGASAAAVLALSLVVASGASAANFTASSYPAVISGEGTLGSWQFITEAGASECKAATSATLSGASSTVTLNAATFSECKGGGFGSTVKSEGCDYLVHLTGGSGDTYTGSADLLCPAGKEMVGVGGPSSNCEIKIPPQNGSVTLKYTNNTAKGYVESEITASNISYTVTKDTGFCPYAGLGAKTGAKITQTGPTPVKLEGGTVVID